MAPKSLLLSYISRKHKKHGHKSESITGMFLLALFAALVISLSATGMHTATSSDYQPQHSGYGSYDYDPYAAYRAAAYSPTGMVAGSPSVFLAMWILALVVLVPLELHLRKN